MAKITRATQKIFGDDVVAQDQHCVFGSLKAGSVAYSKDPATIQSLAAWGIGWKGATVNNQAPVLQDENALHYLITRQIAYLMQAGIPEYDAGTTYYTGSFCQVAGTIYKSLQDNNLNNAVSNGSWWSEFKIALATSEPAAVSSSTSGRIGVSDVAAREDHSHDLGAHTHTDATSGGVIVAASATQQGAVTTGAQTFAGKKTFTTPMQAQVVQSGIAAGSSTCDASAYDTFVKTGSSSATNIGLNNLFEGQTITVLINTVASQGAITWKRGTDSAGTADIKWNAGIIPTPTTTASRYDRYIFQMLGGVIFGSADMNCY